MRTALAALCCAVLLGGCSRPRTWGFKVLSRSTSGLVLLHISWEAGDAGLTPMHQCTIVQYAVDH